MGRGASLQDRNREEETPLLCAANEGHLELVKWLVSVGANINDRNRSRPFFAYRYSSILPLLSFLSFPSPLHHFPSRPPSSPLPLLHLRHPSALPFLSSLPGPFLNLAGKARRRCCVRWTPVALRLPSGLLRPRALPSKIGNAPETTLSFSLPSLAASISSSTSTPSTDHSPFHSPRSEKRVYLSPSSPSLPPC